MNYYNEIDKGARKWLRQLVKDELIPDGFIDNRPIEEVRADELIRAGFRQHHFFAGIGGWPLAFRLAGIPDDEEWWTGSCPCQPFSDSGEQMGFADPRHLFPTWRRLIARCRPARVAGEQVASKLGREWLARVRLEMATLGYATRGSDLCSAGVSAPNRRQRLFWLADTESAGRGVANTNGQRFSERSECDSRADESGEQTSQRADASGRHSNGVALGDTNDARWQGRRLRSEQDSGQLAPWSSGVVGLKCTDGKTRRIKPSIFPLSSRLSGDLALIRGAGNAINPWVAAEFLRDAIGTK